MGLVHVETIPILNDVRMHGFERRAKVETVLAWIDRHALSSRLAELYVAEAG